MVKKIFGIFGFALLVGLLLGMSQTPVVSIAVTALFGLIGLVLGTKFQKENQKGSESINYLLLGVFGIISVCSVLLGLYLRINSPFRTPPAIQLENWKELGFSQDESKEIVLFQETGLKKKDYQFVAKETSQSMALFSAETNIHEKLSPDNYIQLNDLQNAWRAEGEPYIIYNDLISSRIPQAEQLNAYKVIWLLLRKQ